MPIESLHLVASPQSLHCLRLLLCILTSVQATFLPGDEGEPTIAAMLHFTVLRCTFTPVLGPFYWTALPTTPSTLLGSTFFLFFHASGWSRTMDD